MHQQIINHLSSRPFAPILQLQLMYGENTIALKLMCVVDYFLEIKNLYPKILSQPKLLEQLLRFNDYEHFHYFEYRLPNFPYADWILGCQCCEFIAPYKYTLEHMVLSHGRHLSAELCQWCGQHELRDHTQTDTLSQCFHNYYYKKMGSYAGADLNVLIKIVFTQIRSLAVKLGVRTYRNNHYLASKTMAKEVLATGGIDDADISKEVYVTKVAIRVSKTIKLNQLDALFEKAMHYFGITVRNVQHSPIDRTAAIDRASASRSMFESDETGRDIHSVPMMRSSAQTPDTQQMPQIPELQMKSSPPSSTSSFQLASSSSSSAPYNVHSHEIMNLAGFLTSALTNMRNESIRKRAAIKIQQSILQFANEDLQSQIDDTKND